MQHKDVVAAQDEGLPGLPLVSVCITTYNHEKFLAQALDSVLMQRGDFVLEILLGEDGSTDRTADIVRDYAQRFPDIIRAFFHDADDKLFINGRKTGRKNFINNLLNASGDYVALLDGDDYWIDAEKLQKQVTFLEAHSQFVTCCHAAMHVDENGTQLEGYTGHHDVQGGSRDFTVRDALRKNVVPSVSVLFRNPRLQELPAWFYKTDMADWPLQLLNALRGDIHYVDEKMAAYRLHGGGLWADFRASAEKGMLSEISVWILLRDAQEFVAHREYIAGLIAAQYRKLVQLSLRHDDYGKAWQYWQQMAAEGWVNTVLPALAFRIARKQLRHALLPKRDAA